MPKTKLPEGEALDNIVRALKVLKPEIRQAANYGRGGSWTRERISYFVKENAERLAALGLTYLGSGMTRITFAHKDYPSLVFKLDYEDTSDNLREVNAYTRFTPAQRKHLPKVFTHIGGEILLMQRIKGVEAQRHPDCWDAMSTIRSVFYGAPVSDIHDQNVMVTKEGKPVLVDFAATYF